VIRGKRIIWFRDDLDNRRSNNRSRSSRRNNNIRIRSSRSNNRSRRSRRNRRYRIKRIFYIKSRIRARSIRS
jgi:hypothetical protein